MSSVLGQLYELDATQTRLERLTLMVGPGNSKKFVGCV